MTENIEIECTDCHAIYFIKHNLKILKWKKIMKKRKIIININIHKWSIYELRKPLAI